MKDQYTFDAAPYVLGALSPDERRAFEEHLAGCPACAAEVQELGELPALLAQLPADDPALTMTDEQLEPPDALLPALLFDVRRERRQRRWRVRLAAGLAAASVAGLGTAVALQATTTNVASKPPTVAAQGQQPPAIAFQLVRQEPVHATATLVSKAWGTEIRLWCKYSGGAWTDLPSSLSLVAYDAQQGKHQIGSWKVIADKDENLTTATALTRSQLTKLEIVDTTDKPVLELSL